MKNPLACEECDAFDLGLEIRVMVDFNSQAVGPIFLCVKCAKKHPELEYITSIQIEKIPELPDTVQEKE